MKGRMTVGIYSEVIYPDLLEKAMSRPSLRRLRKEVLSEVSGDILEIGFGTGLNLQYYPEEVRHITAIDVNEILGERARARIEKSAIQVDYRHQGAENLPFGDAQFDCVVSTFTFCSIPGIHDAMNEFYRVLKPGGRLFFLEHGLSPDRSVRFMQNLIDPVFSAFSCHLNREMTSIIQSQKFDFVKIRSFYQEDAMIKLGAYLYMGIAMKNDAKGDVVL